MPPIIALLGRLTAPIAAVPVLGLVGTTLVFITEASLVRYEGGRFPSSVTSMGGPMLVPLLLTAALWQEALVGLLPLFILLLLFV